MAFTMPDVFKIRVRGRAATAARTELEARKHKILVDEPAARGGTDLAPSPLETMLSSFLACTNVITNMVAERKGIEIKGMELALAADFDTRGVFDKAEVRIPFPRIELTVKLDTPASDEEIEDLRQAVAVRCPVSVILRESGTEIDDTWERL